MSAGERIAARARDLVGVRFRPQGRDRGCGLDCVGLAAAAAGVSPAQAPSGYALRGGALAAIEERLAALGLRRATAPAPGDIVVVAAGPAQFHLIVLTEDGFVHADAGLRRVVERPGPPPWPVLGRWRAAG